MEGSSKHKLTITDGKRPKLVKVPSVASSESAESQHDLVSSFSSNTVVGRRRIGSVGSVDTHSTSAPSGGHPSPDDFSHVAPIGPLGDLNSVFGAPTPALLSPSSSAGGRDLFHFAHGFPSSLENAERFSDATKGQLFPRIIPLDPSRASPGTFTDMAAQEQSSPRGSFRPSNRVSQQDTASSKSSLRSSDLSRESSAPSSYNSVEDSKSLRSLPPLSTLEFKNITNVPYGEPGGQSRYSSHGGQSDSTHGHASFSPFGSSSSGTFESLQLPLPYNISFQKDQPPPSQHPR